MRDHIFVPIDLQGGRMTLAASDDDHGLVPAVLKLLATPAAARFAALLYGDSAPDGLRPASPSWLADNAETAFGFIADKPGPGHKVRVRRAFADNTRVETSVIEILNDDMPFLVDSVMGELQARGLRVRQLLHPIFKARRDDAGRLLAVLGP